MANQDDQMKLLMDRQIAAIEGMKLLMERQFAHNENSQKTLILPVNGQAQVRNAIVSLQETFGEVAKELHEASQKSEKMDKVIKELQTISQNTDTLSHKLNAMEYRQWYNSSEQKDSIRAMDQFSRGDNRTLSNAQCKGVQVALEGSCASYGDIVVQCDKRRAEHQVGEDHYKDACQWTSCGNWAV